MWCQPRRQRDILPFLQRKPRLSHSRPRGCNSANEELHRLQFDSPPSSSLRYPVSAPVRHSPNTVSNCSDLPRHACLWHPQAPALPRHRPSFAVPNQTSPAAAGPPERRPHRETHARQSGETERWIDCDGRVTAVTLRGLGDRSDLTRPKKSFYIRSERTRDRNAP